MFNITHGWPLGWPVLKNDSDSYCYRCVDFDAWVLAAQVIPNVSPMRVHTFDVDKHGPLPIGTHSWRVADEDCALTVRLLVR